ncbi:MAG: hypothetical protein IKZ91_01400 [Bacteroidales bacterium]|nr:hypothetical protein [Bacteroidales bacterium]
MSKKLTFRDILLPALVLASVVLLIWAVSSPRSVGDTAATAVKVEKHLSRRMKQLDRYIDRPQAKLPSDMVIYTYTDDTLRSWRGQFPLLNDEISFKLVVQRLVSPRANLDSPLSYVTEAPVFMNMGPNWYLVKSREESGTRYVAGLLITSSFPGEASGVNPNLHLGMRYSVKPLTFSEGSAVCLDGMPVFKILYDSQDQVVVADPDLVWLALVLFLSAALMLVFRKRTLRRALISCALSLVAIGAMYLWGRSVQTETQIFSPTLYAGGTFLFSLGAVLLLNLAILACTVYLYLVRRDLWSRVRSVPMTAVLSVVDLAAVVSILAYTHFTLRSIILNSNINLELYKLGMLSWYTLAVYVSVLSMLTSVPMLLQMLQPVCSRLTGRHYDMYSAPARAILALIAAVYIVSAASLLGFEKEQNRVEVWAGRLAVDRDINLELQLLRVEQRINSDPVIATLSGIEGSDQVVRTRIVDNYLLSASQDCFITVQILRHEWETALSQTIRTVLAEGIPITEGSLFRCTPTPDGPSRYDGVFGYFSGDSMVYMLLSVEQKNLSSGKGYERLLSMAPSGRGTISPIYSYARYQETDLRSFRGTYPYATRMDDWMKVMVYVDGVRHFNRDGYVHFVNVITPDEAVIISRRQSRTFGYITSGLMIALLMYLLLWMQKPFRGVVRSGARNYFRQRISLTLMVSLILSLVVLSVVSVTFVYRRNEANQRAIMSDRINAIQLMAQNGVRVLPQQDLLRCQDFASLIQSVSDNTGSDISVYSTEGRIVLSTNPEVLDHQILGYRIEANALSQIMVENKRYCILKQGSGLRHYYNMYMPLIGSDGRPVAILCSPYVETGYDFERDAIMHLMSVLTVFMLLFILARFIESTVLDMVFRPLSMLGLSMRHAGLGSMQHISYTGKDEISSLVDAYNRMVDELSENSRQLAQAERDKAWSGMARQVAHEIKNPLTPMKLQIQRLIRLKQKGDPSWQDKFDEVSTVLLDHIDILTETSNEFSTFARLYSEEHTEINLDALLQEEISMFDNRDDVRFDYIGLSGALVRGPKPQLTRVFVNILGNAVQAVEGLPDARVLVALRKSVRDGYYDIVVEDSGPGVPEENRSRLFTPNFTTKNGGSGLGLAISRSILESCGATIAYSRSFALGGACFTVTYPCGEMIK